MSAPPRGVSFRVMPLGSWSGVWYPRAVLATSLLVALVAGIALLGLMTGTTKLTPAQVVDALTGGRGAAIVCELRLPRVLCGIAVGAALAMAGAVFQSLSRNPLGSPDIIGVTSGAALGAVIAIVLLAQGPVGTVIGAVFGCLAVSLLTYATAYARSRAPGQRLVLIGIGIGAFVHALTALILTHGSPHLALSGQIWLTGSLNARAWTDLLPVAVGLVVLTPVLAGCVRHLNALEAGDDLAVPQGVDVDRVRRVAVAVGVMLCAVAVVAVGPVAFIALAAPHLARGLVGNAAVPVLPAAATGSAILLGADVIGQRLPGVFQVPVGIATSVLGGLYLIFVLARRTR